MSQSENIQLTGPGIGLTFLYYFSMTVVIVVFVGSRSVDFTFASPQLHQYGVVAGLIAGLVGALVNRTVTMDIAFESQEKFLKRLDQNLLKMGFELEADEEDPPSTEGSENEEDYLAYFRTGLAGWFAGGVYVALSDRSVKISSRAINIRRIRKQF